MPVPADLLALLACPDDDHGALEPQQRDGAEILVCQACGKGYRVDGDIPVLLLDDALEAPQKKDA